MSITGTVYNISLDIDKATYTDLQYATIELDIATCQEGQCVIEPDHWTQEEVVHILLAEYLKQLRMDITIRPISDRLWKYILPKTGRNEKPRNDRICAAVEAYKAAKTKRR